MSSVWATASAVLVEQSASPADCHVTINVIVDAAGADRARADFVLVRREGGRGAWDVVNAGRYKDHIVHVDDRWLFAERRIVVR